MGLRKVWLSEQLLDDIQARPLRIYRGSRKAPGHAPVISGICTSRAGELTNRFVPNTPQLHSLLRWWATYNLHHFTSTVK